jgi:hypothetical protein
VITREIRSRWSRPGILDGAHPPSYAPAPPATSARRGRIRNVLRIVPRSGGRGGPKGSSITNDSFLALVSDQGLRTIVIAGRPSWERPTGVATCPATRCRTRTSPTSSPGSARTVSKARATLLHVDGRSIRSPSDVE